MYWQRAASSKKVKGRVYLSSLIEVNVWADQFVYLVSFGDTSETRRRQS